VAPARATPSRAAGAIDRLIVDFAGLSSRLSPKAPYYCGRADAARFTSKRGVIRKRGSLDVQVSVAPATGGTRFATLQQLRRHSEVARDLTKRRSAKAKAYQPLPRSGTLRSSRLQPTIHYAVICDLVVLQHVLEKLGLLVQKLLW